MEKISIFLLFVYVFVPCDAYYASSLMKISSRSFDTAAALRQAAQVLNVGEPGRT